MVQKEIQKFVMFCARDNYVVVFFWGGGEQYLKPGAGGAYAIWSRQEGGRGENKARNETPVLGSFKFNCLVPYAFYIPSPIMPSIYTPPTIIPSIYILSNLMPSINLLCET